MPRLSSHFKRAILWALAMSAVITLITWGSVFYYTYAAERAPAPIKDLAPALTASAAQPLVLHIDTQDITVKPAVIAKWLEPYTRAYNGHADTRITDRLSNYLQTLSQQSSTPAQDVRFNVANGKVTITAPAKAGKKLSVVAADQIVRRALLADISDVTLPVDTIEPAITEDTISHLHLTDKLATGQSNFSGSTAARIQNINVASALYNGMLIPAGQTFSFDASLGSSADVDAAHGYAPEKVIDGGKIVYEYGGGICQVSTTMFRAAINAGLPIVERRPHAFPVHYYDPQGMDATVYPGSADLRFINNTLSYILVQTRISGHYLYFDFYGTSDGRTVTVDGPHLYNQQPDGSESAYFVRTINFADGASKSETFTSVYKSPALFPTEPNPYL